MTIKEEIEMIKVILILTSLSPDIIDVKKPEKYAERVYKRCSIVIQKAYSRDSKEMDRVIDRANRLYVKAIEQFKKRELILDTVITAYTLGTLFKLSYPPYNITDKLLKQMLRKISNPITVERVSFALELAIYFDKAISKEFNLDRDLLYIEKG